MSSQSKSINALGLLQNDSCQAVGVALNDLLREYEYLIGAVEADDFRFRVWAD